MYRPRFIFLVLLVFFVGLSSLAHGDLRSRDWAARIKELEKMPRSAKVRQQIAVCNNNLALEYVDKKDWKNAEKHMRKAYDLDRKEKLYQKHLGDIYAGQAWELFSSRASRGKGGSMHSRAKLLAQRALSFDRNHAEANMIVGRIEYDNQKILAAKRAFEAAYKADPNYSGAKTWLDKVTREAKVEKKYAKTRNSFFELRYSNKNIDKKTAEGLRVAMDTARQIVGKDFAFRPKHKIVVLVYPTSDYSKLQLGPHWAGGSYDGKIRLPLDGQHNLKYAVATLFHEYTHAVIHDLGRGKCPRWLNEGLASIQGYKIDGNPIRELHSAAKDNRLIPVGVGLSSAFHSGNTRMVNLAYEQSRSVAEYLVKKHGYRGVKRVLSELAKDVPMEVAARKAFNRPLARIEQAWREELLASL